MTRFYVDGSLDVMKPLDRGEEELFTIPARSKYGDGVIIVTNFGLAVHTHKTGAILDLSHSEISSIEDAKDGRLCIKWIESSGHEGSLDITTKGSDGAYERISAVRKQSFLTTNLASSMLEISECDRIQYGSSLWVCTASPKFVTIITPSPYFDLAEW